jgi:2,4-dienoyl-CoA reductase-like NADH-dependent reductase (Old Yellow Enzyme family)
MFQRPGEAPELDPLASFGELVRRFERGDFALVGVGRAQIADPDWVNKLRDGRLEAILPYSRELLGEVEWDLDMAMEGLARSGISH